MSTERSTTGRSGEWVLVVLSLCADILGIISFLGIQANHTLRVLIVSALALIGVFAAGGTLISSLRLILSPRGRYYPSALHARRLMIAVVALSISIILAIAVIYIVQTEGIDGNTKKQVPNSISSIK